MLLFAGCTTVETTLPSDQENLKAKCPRLPDLPGGAGTDVYPWALNAAATYNECATRHNGLVDVLEAE